MFLQDPSVENKIHSPIPGRRSISNDARLQGKHFAESCPPKHGKCRGWGCKKGINRKNKDTKTSIFFGKCDKFLCKTCYELYHTRNNV